MNSRRTNAPRKKRTDLGVGIGPTVLPVGDGDGELPGATPVTKSSDTSGLAALKEEVEALLNDVHDLDAEERLALTDHFVAAFQASIDGDESTSPEELPRLAASLGKTGVVSEDDAANFARQLDDALQPLRRPSIQLATGYMQRLQEMGPDAALAWFKEESLKLDADSQTQVVEARAEPTEQSTEITKIRSRRLRGPPRG